MNVPLRLAFIAVLATILGVVVYEQKDRTTLDIAIDVEILITLLLTLAYTFTNESPFWRQYYWIWQIVLLATVAIYLVRMLVTRPRGWENKATSAAILLAFFVFRLGRRARS